MTKLVIKPSKEWYDHEGWVVKYCNMPAMYRRFGGRRAGCEIGVRGAHNTKEALKLARMAIRLSNPDIVREGPVSKLTHGFYNLSEHSGNWLARRYVDLLDCTRGARYESTTEGPGFRGRRSQNRKKRKGETMTKLVIKPSKEWYDHEGWVVKYCNMPAMYRHSFGGRRAGCEIGVRGAHNTKEALKLARMAIRLSNPDIVREVPVSKLTHGFYNLSEHSGNWLARRYVDLLDC